MAYGKSSGLVFDAQELGYLYDSSVNHHTLTNHGATPVRGKFGKGMLFDGVNDYIDCGNNMLNIIKSITIETWVKTTENSTNDNILILGCHGISTSYIDFTYRISGKVKVRVWEAGVATDSLTISSINDGRWHHIVGVRNNNLAIYLDGTSSTPVVDTIGAIDLSGGTLYVGSDRQLAGRYFNGAAASVKIYNRALSAAEISANYKSHGFHGSKMQSPQSLV